MSKIAIVGCDGSGKTVLVSSLSDYYKAGRRQDQACIMVPANSSTRRYVDTLHRVMRIDHKWPQATNDIVGGSALSWNMLRGGKTISEIQLMDFGGENFRYAFRDDGPTTNPEVVAKLKDYIQSADFVIITVGLDKLVRNLTPELYGSLERGDVEFDRDSEAQWVTEGLLKMVALKLANDPPGVVVALTQADKHADVLKEFGGAKGLFVRCWPEIASMYPSLNVVSVASIDRMTEDGMPASGYRTDGVLTVMKEYSRFAFGDVDALFAQMDSEANVLNEAAATDDPRKFLEAIVQFRTRLDELHDRLALVDELYHDRLLEFDRLLENFGERERMMRELVERQFREAAVEAQKRQSGAKVGRQGASDSADAEKADAEDLDRHVKDGFRKSRSSFFRWLAAVIILSAIGYLGVRGYRQWTDSLKNAEMAAEAARAKAAEAAEARKAAEAAEIARRKAAEEAEAAKKKAAEEEAARRKAAEEAAKRKAAAEAAEAAKRKAAAEEAEAVRTRVAAEEAARKKAELMAEAARKRAEEEAAQRKRAEEESRRAQERARAATEAAEKAKAAAEAAEKARIAAEAAAKAKASGPTVRPGATPRKEDQRNKDREMREHRQVAQEQWETGRYFSSLTDSINRGMLESGRNLIATLSGRPMTELQTNQLEYAVTFMDHLEKARNGNGDSMLWIGNQYYNAPKRRGIVKDPPVAYSWYRKAAACGLAQAYYFLSLLTEEGVGCRKDEALAGRYCLKAARLGHPEAMFWTGVYFMDGKLGFEKSPATAYKFFSQAQMAGFKNPSLDRLIKNTERARHGETLDARYPDDPQLLPMPPEKEGPGHWWSFGLW